MSLKYFGLMSLHLRNTDIYLAQRWSIVGEAAVAGNDGSR
jgi:hypothetical protein